VPLPRSDAELFGAHKDVVKNSIKKVAVATVTKVHAAEQTVDVQLAVNNPIFDELGNVATEPAPSLSDVPLGVMRGGGFFVWLPVAIGDSVLVLFSDISTDVWREGDGTAQDPGWVGKHTMDSPFAIPMVAPDAKMFADIAAAAGKVIIGKDGSAAQIRLSATDIELGNNPTDAVALASLVKSEFASFALWVKTGVAPSGGGPVTYAAPAPTDDVGSTLIKAQ
jgi:hypothetical protein